MTLSDLPRRPLLADEVIDRLRSQIVSGAWPVGSRIPTEAALSVTFGVARNTIREAVRALAHTGLLSIKQGSGTFVVATSELAEVMRRRFADADPRHLAEVRSALESAASALAAARRTDADLDRLDAALADREAAWGAGEGARFVSADLALHRAVIAAAHNDVLTELYADLAGAVAEFLQADLDGELPERQYLDHSRLVQAVRDGDAQRAAAEAGTHAFGWAFDWKRRDRSET